MGNQRYLRIPYHMRKKVDAVLKGLQKLYIIEKVKGTTPWISSIVVIPKKNNTIKCIIIIRNLWNGSYMYSKLNLTAWYDQCILNEHSHCITIFTTHIGLRP